MTVGCGKTLNSDRPVRVLKYSRTNIVKSSLFFHLPLSFVYVYYHRGGDKTRRKSWLATHKCDIDFFRSSNIGPTDPSRVV